MQKQDRSVMLGTMKMSRLVPKVSVPIMISMMVQALYNVVDSIFVARYDANSLAAVSLAMPLQMLMIAVSTGLGTGIGSLISRKLGEKRGDDARLAAGNGIMLEVCGYLLFLFIGLFLVRPFMSLMTPDAVLIDLGVKYLRVVCCVSMGLFISISIERLLQSTGNTMLSMCVQLTGAITNIILDPILIFGLLGFPRMGITGAAVATVIGQLLGMCMGIVLNQTKNPELRIRAKYFRPNRFVISEILAVGFPSIIMQAISSVMQTLFNMILMVYGATAVSVLGVYFKLQSFIFMPVFGLGAGMVAIVGYNYGARNRQRVKEAIRVAMMIAVGIMVAGMALFILAPDALMGLFETSGEGSELTKMGEVALRTISLHFILAAIGITLSNVYQAIGKGVYSLIMSLCRQLFVLIPAAWLLSTVFHTVDAVWWSFLIAEFVSLAICLVMYRKVDRDMLSKL